MKKFVWLVFAFLLIAAGCNKHFSSTNSAGNPTSINKVQEVQNITLQEDQESVNQVKIMLNYIDAYYEMNKKFPTDDEFYSELSKSGKSNLKALYYGIYSNTKPGPDRFDFSYTLSQKRDFAIGDLKIIPGEFGSSISYDINENNYRSFLNK